VARGLLSGLGVRAGVALPDPPVRGDRLACLSVTAVVDSARHEWAEGHRRFLAAARDPAVADRLYAHLELVLGDLRRRTGSAFTLAELAGEHAEAERWIRGLLEEHAADGWATTLTTVQAAAFHLASRSATDYEA